MWKENLETFVQRTGKIIIKCAHSHPFCQFLYMAMMFWTFYFMSLLTNKGKRAILTTSMYSPTHLYTLWRSFWILLVEPPYCLWNFWSCAVVTLTFMCISLPKQLVQAQLSYFPTLSINTLLWDFQYIQDSKEQELCMGCHIYP